MTRTTMAALAALVMGASAPALAQDAPSAPETQSTTTANGAADSIMVEVDDDSLSVAAFNTTVGELEDMVLYGADGERVGEIEDVLGSQDGTVTAVAVEVGGLLGVGEREVIIPIDAIELDGLRLSIDYTREEIQELPQWADD